MGSKLGGQPVVMLCAPHSSPLSSSALPPPCHFISPASGLLSGGIRRGSVPLGKQCFLGELCARLGEALCLLWYCRMDGGMPKRRWEDTNTLGMESGQLPLKIITKIFILLLNSQPGESFWGSWFWQCYAAEPKGLCLQSLLYHALVIFKRSCYHWPGLSGWGGRLRAAGSAQGCVLGTERCWPSWSTEAAFCDFMGFSSVM